MPILDIHIGEDERQRKRRRARWLLPLVAGLGAAMALGREKPPAPPKPKPVVVVPTPAPAPIVAKPAPVVVEPPPIAPPPPEPARLAVAPARLDFGDGPLTRAIPAQLATIRNEGGQPLARVRANVDGPFLTTSTCADALAPGTDCVVAVVFAPKESGRFRASMKITAGEQHAQIALRGSVAPPAQPPPPRMLCFDPPLVRFTSPGEQTITLTNPGPLPVSGIDIVSKGATPSGYAIEARDCRRKLAGGQQCKFTVRANELALQTGEKMVITISYDDPATGGRRVARVSSACR